MKADKRFILPILFLIDTPLLLAVILFVVFGFSGYYGQDSHEYLRFAQDWKSSGFDSALLEGFHWPVGYPLAGIALSYLGLSLKWSLVLVSFLSLWGVLLLLKRMIREMYGRDGTVWILLGAATQVYFVRAGMLAMSDMFCAFLVIATVYFLLKYKQQKQWRFLLFACLFAMAAFEVRYAVAPLLFIPFVPAFAQVFREEKTTVRLFAGFLLFGLCGALVYANGRFFSILSEMLNQWHPSNFLALSGEAESGWQERTVPNILYVFGNFAHLGYLSAGIFLLPFYRRISWKHSLFLGIGMYLLFIMGLETQNYRFLLIIHPLILFMLFPAFDGLKRDLQTRRIWLFFLVGMFLVNASFFVYSFRKTYAVYHTEKVVTDALKNYDSGEPVYTFYVDQSFRTYGVKNEVRNLYLEQYTEFENGALVVFNPEKFEAQWKNTNVGKNWTMLTEKYTLDTLQNFNDGWSIYRIR